MPIYNSTLQEIDPKETRRYAGLMKADSFKEDMITDACQDARLLAEPRGIWQLYDYDCETQVVKADPPFLIQGKKIGKHLAGCDKVILLSATVGDGIEEMVTKSFQNGEYAKSVLLDAAATTAVEQVADGMEKYLKPLMAAKGYHMRWRFSPGYGDWPLDQQPEMIRTTKCEAFGVHLSSSCMLVPRKSITAIIGLYRGSGKETGKPHTGCSTCPQKNCPSRKVPTETN